MNRQDKENYNIRDLQSKSYISRKKKVCIQRRRSKSDETI